MKNQKVAVLLTCHNRKSKTLACLDSLFEATVPPGYTLDVYLMDDGSTDQTGEAVKERYPSVALLEGDGNLFWAGGMRKAWRAAMDAEPYDAFLLINDDVVLYPGFMGNMLKSEEYALEKRGKKGIYSGATINEETRSVSYGGSRLSSNPFIVRMKMLAPGYHPKECMVTNANILWISKNVVEEIGVFDDRFTHGIADYDYSLRAFRRNIPVYLAPGVCGTCTDDHGNNWRSQNYPLKDRVAYLKSPKGLAYSEYLYYVRKNLPLFLPYSFIMLWMKTLFPIMWYRVKS